MNPKQSVIILALLVFSGIGAMAQQLPEIRPLLTREDVTLGPIRYHLSSAIQLEVQDGQLVYRDPNWQIIVSGEQAKKRVVNRMADGTASLEDTDGTLFWSQPAHLPMPGLMLQKAASGASTLVDTRGRPLWAGFLKPGGTAKGAERLPSPDSQTIVTQAGDIRFVTGHGRASVEDETQHRVLWGGSVPDPPYLNVRADGRAYGIGPSETYSQPEDWTQTLDLVTEAGSVRLQDGQGQEIGSQPVELARLTVTFVESGNTSQQVGTPEVKLTKDGVVLLTFLGADGKPVRYERLTRWTEMTPGKGGHSEAVHTQDEFLDKDGHPTNSNGGVSSSWHPDPAVLPEVQGE